MESLSRIYKGRFFARRNKLSWRAPIMAKAIIKTFDPETVIDVGCATGDIIAELQKREIVAHGIEGSDQVLEYLEVNESDVFIVDLRLSLPSKYLVLSYDLVMSLEVAEHIEPEYADIYLDNLCSLGDRILITAAPPGQGGHYHVNCQIQGYWVSKFYDRGFLRSTSHEEGFKSYISDWKHKKGIKAYYNNVMFFESP